MARPTVVFHPAALDDAGAAENWYRARSSAAAAAFVAELDRAIHNIVEAPDRWKRHRRGTRRFVLRRFPFTVVYRVRRRTIEVVAVAHGRRHPDYWKGRP